MSEVEILVTGKNLAKAAFASASADTSALQKRADELALSMRRASLAASSAGTSAERAMGAAAAAADKAAESAKAAADAQGQLARGEISAQEAAKADAIAQQDVAKASEAAARAAQAAERASIAQATAVKRAGEESAAAADLAAAGSGRMAAGLEKLRSVGKAALEGLVIGGVAVGVESIKMGMKFDQAMELIHTQAGVAQDKLGQLKAGVLSLAGKVGQDPDSLAEALYHVESNFASLGISSQKALEITRVAAEGASVGNANLVDVTNALTAAVASGIPGVKNMDQAMGALNATVGAGDMKMQDLADAFGTGMVAVVKGYGLSITDVGAALATFGDNNIRGAKAGTELRMAVQAMAVPAKSAGDSLKLLGMSTDTLAKDMQKGGLKLALQDLVDRMHKAGISAKEQGQIITDMFGKKAGTGIDILIGQFDRLKSKYPDIEKGAHTFAESWDATQKTFSNAWNRMEDAVKALMIQLGEKLMPIATKVMNWMSQHTGVIKILAGVITSVLLVAIGAYVVEMSAAAAATIAATWPILAIVGLIAGLAAGVLYAYNHFKPFREFMEKMWDGIKVAWDEAKKHWEILLIAITGPLGILVAYFKQHTDQLKKIWQAVWDEVQKDWKKFQNGPLKDIQHGIDQVEKTWKQHSREIQLTTKAVWDTISLYIDIAIKLIGRNISIGLTQIKSVFKTGWGAVKDGTKAVWQLMGDYINLVMHYIHNVIVLVMDLIHGKWSKVWGDMKTLVGTTLKDIATMFVDLTKNWGTLLYDAGRNVIQGMINGMMSMINAVKGAISDIVSSVTDHLPHSPAKVGPLSGEGSPDKSGAKIVSMLADGMTSNVAVLSTASDKVAATALSGLSSRHRGHHPRLTINQQLGQLAHAEGHMSTHSLDAAIEKLMRQHRLTVAQLTQTMQILLAKGGHHVTTSKINDLVAEMKKQYKGLTSKEILDAAISELEKHPKLSTSQLMKDVAGDLHAQLRKTKSAAGGSGGSGSAGYISDLTWQAGGVRYTVGGAGRTTGPGGSAAGSTSGSASVGAGQALTIDFATLHIELDLKDSSGRHSDADLRALRKAIRIRGGNVQKVLGH